MVCQTLTAVVSLVYAVLLCAAPDALGVCAVLLQALALTHRVCKLVGPAPNVIGLVAEDVSEEDHCGHVGLGGHGHIRVQSTCPARPHNSSSSIGRESAIAPLSRAGVHRIIVLSRPIAGCDLGIGRKRSGM